MNRKRLATFWEQYGTLCILVLIIVVFSGLSSDFMKPENIVQIFVQSAITILVALGEFFAILIAGIDLSVGSIVAITGILTAKLMVAGLHPILAVLVGGIGVGIVLGAFNGMLVNFRFFGDFRGIFYWSDGGCAPPNPAPLAAAGVRGEHERAACKVERKEVEGV
jgi:ribose/xylose/arabinose/galactoside ABC-type transport system permease subunit